MALEAVVFQQDHPFGGFGYGNNGGVGKDLCGLFGGSPTNFFLESQLVKETPNRSCDDGIWEGCCDCYWDYSSPLPRIEPASTDDGGSTPTAGGEVVVRAARRRRTRSRKNKEEIESQRMTHIAVERNRRKQMNEYLSVLRSLMPDSYVQRGDQASIIGGAINYVKELEQKLQTRRRTGRRESENGTDSNPTSSSPPFSDFFAFPQYSMADRHISSNQNYSSVADIEVTMAESHANLKIRTRRRPKLLLRMVSSLHVLRLTILHLNVTTVDLLVLYSVCVKVEEDCKLSSVDEIASAVNQLLGGIQEETGIWE